MCIYFGCILSAFLILFLSSVMARTAPFDKSSSLEGKEDDGDRRRRVALKNHPTKNLLYKGNVKIENAKVKIIVP